jgi:multidrug efflux system membrane fusion protein
MPAHGRAHRFFIAAAGLALMLSALGAAGCRKKAAPPPRPPPLVTVGRAIARDVPLYLDEIGSCVSPQAVAIRPQASGQVMQQHFTDGATVKKGDLLFTIDSRPYQAALDQARAALAQNQASLGLAMLEFARAGKLYPAKAMSKEDFETRENAVAVSRAQIQASTAAIETAQVNLDYCFIHSPADGRASLRLVDPGNIVTANSGANMLTIERLDPMDVDFIITEQDLPAVRRQMATHTLQTLAWLPSENINQARAGELTFLDNSVLAGTGTVHLRSTFPNADHHLWPAQFVYVRLVLEMLKKAVLVPSEATQISQSGPFVYVVKNDQTAELRPVKLGQRHGPLVAVAEGLNAGEAVILTGQLTVVPGRPVRIAPPATQPAARGANGAATSSAPASASAPASGESS